MDKDVIYNDLVTNIHFSDFKNLESIINSKNQFLIIDNNINKLYGNYFKNFDKFIIESKEQNKSIISYQNCINQLINNNVDKNITIFGIGGGIVCDFAGFVASTYKRGTKLILVPTSLLAQVDAAIGGKCALNFNKIKNVIGTFKQAEQILIIPEFLQTLNDDEFVNGLAEVLKIAIIYDYNLFEILENNNINNYRSNSELIKRIISKSINDKMEIVSQDYYDKGIRKILNAGHTIGHAIESKYELPHGKSVALGLKITTELSLKLNYINQNIYERVLGILLQHNLISDLKIDFNKLFKYILNDKKAENNKISEILILDIGKYKIEEFDIQIFKEKLNALC
jgi:3-dehydroquinate synthase